jgi:hypothetical protein
MRKTYPVLLCLLLTVKPPHAFSQDEPWDLPVSRGKGETIKHGLIASAETILSNGSLMIFNYFIQGTDWGLPTKESIRDNFTIPWEWEDTDDFVVNQIGHPIQGLLTFGAGRANGFGFYQSVFFTALQSSTWETFGESTHASVNDFITTTIGSLATGEIFYRLYLEACAAGIPAPLAFFVNPMAGFHRLVSGCKPPNSGRNLSLLQFHLGGTYAETHYTVSNKDEEVFSFCGPVAEIGARVIYGNPFEQDTWIPYRHFEFSIFYALNLGSYNHLLIISDGYLFSFSPVNTVTDAMSTGLSLHFDFRTIGEYGFGLEDSTIDQYSNALDWTVKYQHIFSQDAVLQTKFHSGITFFGTSEYYANLPVINEGPQKKDYNNFGAGLNCKWFTALRHKK